MAMNRYKVEARSLEAAMQKVKEQFGPDALVLDVREYQRKEADGLGVGTVFELTVAPEGESASHARVYRENDVVHFTNVSLEKLRRQIERLEGIVQSVNAAGERMVFALNGAGRYPLGEILLEKGASRRTVEVLASSFEENVPPAESGSIEAAANHLSTYIHAVNTNRWEDVSGVHFFFGAGGSGKTSVVIKLAGRLARTGKEVVIIGFLPRHGGDIKRLEVAGDALGVQVAVAFSLDDLRKAAEAFQGKVLLVDTPCCLSEKTILSEHFRQYLETLSLAHKHYIFDLNMDVRVLERSLEVYRLLRCDYAILSKLDVSMRKAAFLDLVVRHPIVFSFLNGSVDFEQGFSIASLSLLLRLISPELTVEKREDVKKSLNTEAKDTEKMEGGEDSEIEDAVLEYA